MALQLLQWWVVSTVGSAFLLVLLSSVQAGQDRLRRHRASRHRPPSPR